MRGSEEIDNSASCIDSRAIIARIEYLRGDLNVLCDAVNDAGDEDEGDIAKSRLARWLGCDVDALPSDLGVLDDLKKSGYRDGSDEARELSNLEELASQCDGYGDWIHGATLIRESSFQNYAEEMAYDIGSISRDAEWPLNHIDWDAASQELLQDYSTVDFDGVDYYIRS